MAVLDPERGVVVVRLVYDGTPYAGKTTSVRSLARSLVRRVDTPLEAAGRTMYFDWMEYTGGLFEGHQIRCQVVSVPGQPNLAPRRKAILATADAVVFVADTSSVEASARSASYVSALHRVVRELDPPVGVVIQANKRDVPGALPRGAIASTLGVDGVAITESVAHDGQGVRETFVLAVRLALDRVRDLIARGKLPRGKPVADSAEELLAALAETGPASLEPSDVDPGPAASAALPPAPRSGAPRAPDARVPSGAIWPAVDGRVVLHEATVGDLSLQRTSSGDWIAGLGTEWRLHSPAGATFADLDEGREALRRWARAHATRTGLLSPQRCIVVAEANDAEWRLWQIVRAGPSLLESLRDAAESNDGVVVLDALASAARALARAAMEPAAAGLSLTLESVGLGERGAQYVGLMPRLDETGEPPRARDAGFVRAELEAVFGALLWDRRVALRDALRRWRTDDGWATEVAALVSESRIAK